MPCTPRWIAEKLVQQEYGVCSTHKQSFSQFDLCELETRPLKLDFTIFAQFIMQDCFYAS